MNRPEKGIFELKEYIHMRSENDYNEEIQGIIQFFVSRNTANLNMLTRILILSSLETIIYEIHKTRSGLKSLIPDIISSVLTYFADPFVKVRFQAVSSVYNILNLFDNDYLGMFTKIFTHLLQLVNDQDPDVKVAVEFLNHTLKKLLNDAIFDHQYFDVNQFMSIMIENFITESPTVKEFLIDWLVSIDEIPEFEISFYLPLVLKELFRLTQQTDSKSLKDKSQECLKNFLTGFREIAKGSNTIKLKKKIKQDSFSMLLGVLLEVIREAIQSEIKYHSLEWLQVFTQLFYNQLVKKECLPQVRESFKTELFLKQIKSQNKIHRTSKILSLIREQAMQSQLQLSGNMMSVYSQASEENFSQKSSSSIVRNIAKRKVSEEVDERQLYQFSFKGHEDKLTEFLVQIFLSYYSQIIVLVMHSFSDDNQKIRKITIRVNNILLKSFPIIQEKAKIHQDPNIFHLQQAPLVVNTQSQDYLEKMEMPLIIKLGKFLKQSRSAEKIQAIIRWIKILYEKGTNPQLNLEISSLTQKIVEKICDQGCSNKELFGLLADSIFMEKYLELFIQNLLSYFFQNQNVDSQKILIDVISMKVNQQSNNKNNKNNNKNNNNNIKKFPSTEIRYIAILKRLVLFEAQKGKFKKMMIENLISILITEESLHQLRKKLRSTLLRQISTSKDSADQNAKQKQTLDLIKKLFQYFCVNEGFTIIFCFMTGMYYLVERMIKHIAYENILDRVKIREFIKASNLLQCYNLNHFRLQLMQSFPAMKAYLSFSMIIPSGKLNSALLNRIPQDFSLQQTEEDYLLVQNKKSKLLQINFQQELFDIYLKTVQKTKQQTKMLQKFNTQRKARQRDASISRKPTIRQSKSILKNKRSDSSRQIRIPSNLNKNLSLQVIGGSIF